MTHPLPQGMNVAAPTRRPSMVWEGERAVPSGQRAAFKRMNDSFLAALRQHHGARAPIVKPRQPPTSPPVYASPPEPVEPVAPHVPLSVHLLDDLDEAELVQIRSILRRDSVRRVVEAISAKTGIPVVRIVSLSRNKAVVAARHWAFYELHQAGFSLMQVGRMFHKDHTTILHGVRKHAAHTGAVK